MGQEDSNDHREQGAMSPSNGFDGDALIVAPIEIIIPTMLSENESDEEEKVVKRKKNKKKKVVDAPVDKRFDKTMMLTKTFGQAMRLINEQKVSKVLEICILTILESRRQASTFFLPQLDSSLLDSAAEAQCCRKLDPAKA